MQWRMLSILSAARRVTLQAGIAGLGIPRPLLAFILLINANSVVGQIGVTVGQEPTPVCRSNRPVPKLSATAEQVASAIGVLPLVHRMRGLASGCNTDGSISVEELTLRQQITEAVLVAFLDIDGVLAEIDYERAQISELRDRLTSRRSRKVNVLTLASIIIGSGSGVVGTAMQFSNPVAKTGDWIQTVGGAGGVVLSILALRQQGGEGSLGSAPNMLGPIFGRTAELGSVYPQSVWTYLNTVPASDPRVHVSWRSQLIAEWIRLGRIGPSDAPESQQGIDKLASRISDHKQLSIDSLTDRSSMLRDLRSRVSLMNRDLRDIMKTFIPPAP